MFGRTFKWLLPPVLAVLFLAAPALLAKGQAGSQLAPATNKAARRQHRKEVKYQRRRIKQSAQRIKAEASRSGHPAKPPKAIRHRVARVPRHKKIQNPNLRRARKLSRSRRSAHHQNQPN